MTDYLIQRDRAQIDVANGWDWDLEIADLDEAGQPISHQGQTMQMQIRNGADELLTTLQTGDGTLMIKPGTTNTILVSIPYATVTGWPTGSYYGDLVQVLSASSRKFIAAIQFNHGASPTR